ncbi:aldose epimerase family protein [Actinocorallia longicatena]|uniref:Aldose 1-epimerase n=1 Tax=Actinocorallia longicatena TaxID=111803 RepID=A0ABP6QMW0_9ACTN
MTEDFGTLPTGERVRRHTLENGAGLRVRILTYGCAIQTLEVPGRDGRPANVVLGCATLDGYLDGGLYLGAVAGRFANRIAGGRFTLDGAEYRLPCNNGPASLHGGVQGFDKKVWTAVDSSPAHLTLAHTSPDGDEGYPGTLSARVTYTLTGDALRIDHHATTDAPTVVNLTNHSYFNLAGEGSGDVLGHLLSIDAAHYLPTDAHQLPTGALAPVAGTPFDFTTPRPVGARIGEPHPDLLVARGYDHCYVLTGGATLTDPGSGRVMEVTTTEPGVQLYTGNFLDGTVRGTSGRPYGRAAGLCLETQHFPDSPNRPSFPDTTLRPGETYSSTTVFRFSRREW